ncbi:zinc transporter ZntB [Pseudomonas sp. R-28-1W-6]|uniref:zinc transporter ZntB n=1 Tax=Pseudomonas sp. R-28-1W-6 TaxID=2650101 RepID=UPI0013667121|nr:zinc transporter ZntB [Pseudomonas sp. R-28-1W-6]MWV12769.1 zinc transporter ZntB [Pseudomonas sp. R-28-1W-6]
MLEQENLHWGLVHAFVLDGQGGARSIARAALDDLQLKAEESLWLHWDRSHLQAQAWLRTQSGLDEFSCNLLLEENTRPRVLALPADELLLFLRGVNLNPGAEPEDMVSVRIFANARRVISLRLRPLRATEELIAQLAKGTGPKSSAELILFLAENLTDRVDTLVSQLSELLDEQEERLDGDERYLPDHGKMLQVRRRAAGLRRFLAPQRDIYAQLVRNGFGWFVVDDAGYWNELHNRLTRYLEELELLRERVGLVLESEHRRLSERMGRTMYWLGIITGFFLPISCITGLLGINVGGIPGADSNYGFFIACVLIGAVATFQWWLFRRLRWL